MFDIARHIFQQPPVSLSRPLFRRVAGMALIATALSGCAEIELISHTTKKVANSVSTDRAIGEGGYYKVGKPYQIKGQWYYPAVDYDYVETGVASWYGPGFHGKQTANGEIFDENALTAAHRTLPMPSFVRVTNLDNGRVLTLRVNDRGPFAHNRIIDVSKRAAELLGFRLQGTAKVRVEIMPEESRQIASLAQGGQPEGLKPNQPASQVVANRESTTIVNEELSAPVEKVKVEGLTELEPLPSGTVSSSDSVASTAPQSSARTLESTLPANDGVVTRVPVGKADFFVQAGAFSKVHNAYRLQARLSSLGNTSVTEIKSGERIFYRVRVGPLNSVEEADNMLALLRNNGFDDSRIVIDQ
ncbi:septal ring lytic transglycosylase RlpA family protein [Kiloniella sp. b19]|uniref:septal ring lytic transglycosylase RlpA family protein n=1 Tax=Kiloniella sp. GXU_MW_B19 TaxID=3141326 RepID=UPI0031DEABF8